MRRLCLLVVLFFLLPSVSLADYPPSIPYGDLSVQAESLDAKGKHAVYMGPGGEYDQSGNGKAAVAVTDWVQLFCTENGYTLVHYEIDFQTYRFGWIKGEYTDRKADFDDAKAMITRNAVLTDDPLGQRRDVCIVPVGTSVTWLGSMGSAWIYIQAEAEDKPVRGFVLRDHIELLEPEKVYADRLYPIRKGDLWGYMNYQGEVVIEPQYEAACEFRGAGYAIVVEKGGSWETSCGIIDTYGNWVVEPRFAMADGHGGALYGGEDNGIIWIYEDDCAAFFYVGNGYLSDFEYGSAASPWVSETDLLIAVDNPEIDGGNYIGFVDRSTGKMVLDYQYGDNQNSLWFDEGYVTVSTLNAEGAPEETIIINKNGERLSLPEEVYLDPWFSNVFSDGLLAVCNEDCSLYGFINTEGKLVIPFRYTATSYAFSEGLCFVYDENDRAGYIDLSGEWVVPAKYDGAGHFRHGVASVYIEDEYILIDKTGQELYRYPYEMYEVFFNDYGVGISIGGVFINTNGEEIIGSNAGYKAPASIESYDHAFISNTFEEGLQAMFAPNGLMGYLDTQGNVVIPFEWDTAYRFRHGLARVEKDGQMAYLDHEGNVVWREVGE